MNHHASSGGLPLRITLRRIGGRMQPTLRARDLYAALGITTSYCRWLKTRIEPLMHFEDDDYVAIPAESAGRPRHDLHMTLAMAAEITFYEGRWEPLRRMIYHFIMDNTPDATAHISEGQGHKNPDEMESKEPPLQGTSSTIQDRVAKADTALDAVHELLQSVIDDKIEPTRDILEVLASIAKAAKYSAKILETKAEVTDLEKKLEQTLAERTATMPASGEALARLTAAGGVTPPGPDDPTIERLMARADARWGAGFADRLFLAIREVVRHRASPILEYPVIRLMVDRAATSPAIMDEAGLIEAFRSFDLAAIDAAAGDSDGGHATAAHHAVVVAAFNEHVTNVTMRTETAAAGRGVKH